eukprot:11201408-Ditylum_brightwellii.AAC.1
MSARQKSLKDYALKCSTHCIENIVIASLYLGRCHLQSRKDAKTSSARQEGLTVFTTPLNFSINSYLKHNLNSLGGCILLLSMLTLYTTSDDNSENFKALKSSTDANVDIAKTHLMDS